MDVGLYQDIWVYLEMNGGKPEKAGLELLTPARKLADYYKQRVTAVIIGRDSEEGQRMAEMYGADRIILVEGESLAVYSTEAFAYVMTQLINKYKPNVLLLGASVNGRDLAPRLACRFRTGLTADCTGIDVDREKDTVVFTRPAFGGNLMAEIICPHSRPQMATVRSGVFKLPEKLSGGRAHILREEISVPESVKRTKLIHTIRQTAEDMLKLEDAEIIVAGGRGMRSGEDFSLLQELADILGGTVGGSRAAVDAGYIPQFRQIGQSGKTVQPKLYIACGISGAIQHLAGIGGADTVIAVNIDPDAPIFNIADVSITGDLFEIIPAFIEEIKKMKAVRQ